MCFQTNNDFIFKEVTKEEVRQEITYMILKPKCMGNTSTYTEIEYKY